MAVSQIRRAGLTDDGHVFVEVGPGELYRLPGRYDARAVLRRVARVGAVDLALWTTDVGTKKAPPV